MDPTQSTSRGIITLRNGLGLSLWTVLFFAALSITNLPGNWGHSVCGVWGCGPPTQVLVGCHLAWLVVLVPLSMLLCQPQPLSIRSPQHLGKILFITGAIMVLGVVLYQAATWLPTVSDWKHSYFIQRCGFVIVTSVDIPMLQLIAIGLFMIRRGARHSTPRKKCVVLNGVFF